MKNIYCFLNKINKNIYGISIIYYIDDTRIEYLKTIYESDYNMVEIKTIIEIINFCYINKLKKYIIFINIKNCIKKISKLDFFLKNYIIYILRINGIKFKDYGLRENYYKYLSSSLIIKIPQIYHNIDNDYNTS